MDFTLYLPHVVLGLLMFHYSDATSQSTVVHTAAKSPLIALGIINFDCFEIGSAVEASNSVELTVDNGETNLTMEKKV
jgi:hypothetical protein